MIKGGTSHAKGREEITVDDNKSVPGNPVISKMLGLLPKFPPENFISGPFRLIST